MSRHLIANIATQYFAVCRYFVVLFCTSEVQHCATLFLDVAVIHLKVTEINEFKQNISRCASTILRNLPDRGWKSSRSKLRWKAEQRLKGVGRGWKFDVDWIFGAGRNPRVQLGDEVISTVHCFENRREKAIPSRKFSVFALFALRCVASIIFRLWLLSWWYSKFFFKLSRKLKTYLEDSYVDENFSLVLWNVFDSVFQRLKGNGFYGISSRVGPIKSVNKHYVGQRFRVQLIILIFLTYLRQWNSVRKTNTFNPWTQTEHDSASFFNKHCNII